METIALKKDIESLYQCIAQEKSSTRFWVAKMFVAAIGAIARLALLSPPDWYRISCS